MSMKKLFNVLILLSLTLPVTVGMGVTKYAKLGTTANWNASNEWGQKVDDGVWDNVTNVLAPAVSPGWTVNALATLKVQIGTVLYTISSNTADNLTTTASSTVEAGTYSWILYNDTTPVADDIANLNGGTVNMDVTRIPATGTLLELQSKTIDGAGSAGCLTVTLTALDNCSIYATTITGGTVNTGLIKVSGVAPTKRLTIVGNIYGGTVSGSSTVYTSSTGGVTITGNITGGSFENVNGCVDNHGIGLITINGNITGGDATTAFGVLHETAGTVIVNGNVTGGSEPQAYGIDKTGTGPLIIVGDNVTAGDGEECQAICIEGGGIVTITADLIGGNYEGSYGLAIRSGGTTTINGNIYGGTALSSSGIYVFEDGGSVILNGNMINTAICIAWEGKPPTTWNTTSATYVQWGNVKFPMQLPANQVLYPIVHGDRVGKITLSKNNTPRGIFISERYVGDILP